MRTIPANAACARYELLPVLGIGVVACMRFARQKFARILAKRPDPRRLLAAFYAIFLPSILKERLI